MVDARLKILLLESVGLKTQYTSSGTRLGQLCPASAGPRKSAIPCASRGGSAAGSALPVALVR